MKVSDDHLHAMQRIKVGMIGLASVILLIAIASAIMGSVTRERPIATAGSAQPDVVANMMLADNTGMPNEPLAEMGVAPVTSNMIAPAAASPQDRRAQP